MLLCAAVPSRRRKGPADRELDASSVAPCSYAPLLDVSFNRDLLGEGQSRDWPLLRQPVSRQSSQFASLRRACPRQIQASRAQHTWGEESRETEAAGTMRRRSSAARGRRRGGGRSCAERRERQGGGERLDGGESSPLGFGGGRRP
jgi:hypothetical protein